MSESIVCCRFCGRLLRTSVVAAYCFQCRRYTKVSP